MDKIQAQVFNYNWANWITLLDIGPNKLNYNWANLISLLDIGPNKLNYLITREKRGPEMKG